MRLSNVLYKILYNSIEGILNFNIMYLHNSKAQTLFGQGAVITHYMETAFWSGNDCFISITNFSVTYFIDSDFWTKFTTASK